MPAQSIPDFMTAEELEHLHLPDKWPQKRKLPTFAWQAESPDVNAGGIR